MLGLPAATWPSAPCACRMLATPATHSRNDIIHPHFPGALTHTLLRASLPTTRTQHVEMGRHGYPTRGPDPPVPCDTGKAPGGFTTAADGQGRGSQGGTLPRALCRPAVPHQSSGAVQG